MKNEWLITFRSVTFAQRAEQILRNHHIACAMQRTPKKLTERGCSYCLRLSGENALVAAELLREEKLPFERVYVLKEDGSTQQWRV